MDLIFAGAFLVVASFFAGVAVFVTEKLKDLTGWSTKMAGYVLSLLSSAVLVITSKFIGVETMLILLTMLLGSPGAGEPPEIPAGAEWMYWIFIGILSWLVAGGFYDFRKKTMKKVSAR